MLSQVWGMQLQRSGLLSGFTFSQALQHGTDQMYAVRGGARAHLEQRTIAQMCRVLKAVQTLEVILGLENAPSPAPGAPPMLQLPLPPAAPEALQAVPFVAPVGATIQPPVPILDWFERKISDSIGHLQTLGKEILSRYVNLILVGLLFLAMPQFLIWMVAFSVRRTAGAVNGAVNDVAEQVFADTMPDAFASAPRGRPATNFAPWLAAGVAYFFGRQGAR